METAMQEAQTRQIALWNTYAIDHTLEAMDRYRLAAEAAVKEHGMEVMVYQTDFAAEEGERWQVVGMLTTYRSYQSALRGATWQLGLIREAIRHMGPRRRKYASSAPAREGA